MPGLMQFHKFIIPIKSYTKSKPKIKDVGPGETKIQLRVRFIRGNVFGNRENIF